MTMQSTGPSWQGGGPVVEKPFCGIGGGGPRGGPSDPSSSPESEPSSLGSLRRVRHESDDGDRSRVSGACATAGPTDVVSAGTYSKASRNPSDAGGPPRLCRSGGAPTTL